MEEVPDDEEIIYIVQIIAFTVLLSKYKMVGIQLRFQFFTQTLLAVLPFQIDLLAAAVPEL